MTRRTFVLVALGITMFVGSHATVARAYEPCDDQQENRCVQIATTDAGLLHVTSVDAPIIVAHDDLAPLRGHEQAMRSLGSANTEVICSTEPTDRPLCYMPQADGSGAVEALQADGRWVQSGTQMHPPSLDDLQRG